MGKSVLEARNRMAFNYSGARRWGLGRPAGAQVGPWRSGRVVKPRETRPARRPAATIDAAH
ncbi:hypothetical protein C6P78_19025 [Burkholderia multivorans]|nr:hypothetical protein C6P78_19025 [Burkholderia multivorans]